MTITCATRGDVPVPAAHPPIVAAIGVDTDPIDVGDPLQARWLEACVWPDQVERFERLARGDRRSPTASVSTFAAATPSSRSADLVRRVGGVAVTRS